MLSLQQQSSILHPNNAHLISSINPNSSTTDSAVNSQQGLADKIQAVRHLWDSENPSNNNDSTNSNSSIYPTATFLQYH